MSRRRTHDEAIRNRLITIRVTEAQHARLRGQAEDAGMTISGLAEQLVCKGRVAIVTRAEAGLDRAMVSELKRLGNNLNQIAHAANAGLPPSVPAAAKYLHDLMTLLVKDHYFVTRIQAARSREAANDSSPSLAREEFQRNA
jgi:hypothetical protein